jgi:molybdate transport system substrate-binding protein
MLRKIFLLLAVLWSGTVCFAGQVTVSAAISLKESLTEIAGLYQGDTGTSADLNFGASGTLAAQIQHGAPVDLFISASNKEANDLAGLGLVDPASKRVIVRNELVLIVPKDFPNPPASLNDLVQDRFHHVAIGEPKVVPAGKYAMETLKSLGLDEKLAAKLIMGENVRQVLSYVVRAEAEAGLVYATDAKEAGDQVKVALTVDDATHEPIVYPAVIVKSGNHDEAEKFMDYLRGDKARAVFAKHGFIAPGDEAAK